MSRAPLNRKNYAPMVHDTKVLAKIRNGSVIDRRRSGFSRFCHGLHFSPILTIQHHSSQNDNRNMLETYSQCYSQWGKCPIQAADKPTLSVDLASHQPGLPLRLCGFYTIAEAQNFRGSWGLSDENDVGRY